MKIAPPSSEFRASSSDLTLEAIMRESLGIFAVSVAGRRPRDPVELPMCRRSSVSSLSEPAVPFVRVPYDTADIPGHGKLRRGDVILLAPDGQGGVMPTGTRTRDNFAKRFDLKDSVGRNIEDPGMMTGDGQPANPAHFEAERIRWSGAISGAAREVLQEAIASGDTDWGDGSRFAEAVASRVSRDGVQVTGKYSDVRTALIHELVGIITPRPDATDVSSTVSAWKAMAPEKREEFARGWAENAVAHATGGRAVSDEDLKNGMAFNASAPKPGMGGFPTRDLEPNPTLHGAMMRAIESRSKPDHDAGSLKVKPDGTQLHYDQAGNLEGVSNPMTSAMKAISAAFMALVRKVGLASPESDGPEMSSPRR